MFSCQQPSSMLPRAHHDPGRILIVAEPLVWAGAAGEAFRAIFLKAMPSLPQPEPFFTLLHVSPAALSPTLKKRDKIIILSVDQQRAAAHQLMNDRFARGQSLLFVTADTVTDLAVHVETHGLAFRKYFVQKDKAQLAKELFSKRNKKVEEWLQQTYRIAIKLPHGYAVAKSIKEEGSHFLWLRNYTQTLDKNIWMVSIPFTDELTEQAVGVWRARFAKKYMRDSEKKSIYLAEQSVIAPLAQATHFHQMHAVEYRGLWRLSDYSNGGPFLGYAFVLPAVKKLYYIEGFVYCPAKDKRYFMYEMEIILRTLNISQ